MEAIESILNRFESLLRFFAPGFSAFIFAHFLGLIDEAAINNTWDISTPHGVSILFFTCFIGLLIYTIHILFPNRVFSFLIVMLLKRCDPDVFSKLPHRPVGELIIECDIDRWKRRHSKGESLAIQKGIDQWVVLNHFLLCSSYSALLLAAFSLINSESVGARKAVTLLIFGSICLVVGLASHYRWWRYEFKVFFRNTVHPLDEESTGTQPGPTGPYASNSSQ